MLPLIEIENFKAFRKLSLPLRPLTLLSGLNGMGKSTVLQVLLLLRQNAWVQSLQYNLEWMSSRGEGPPTWFESPASAPTLNVNGDYIQLGTAYDIFARDANTNEMQIRLISEFVDYDFPIEHSRHKVMHEVKFVFTYNASENSLRIAPSSSWPAVDIEEIYPIGLRNLLEGDHFQYLGADRVTPQTTFALDDSIVRKRQLGLRGEFTAHFLHYWTLQADHPLKVPEILQHSSSESTNISTQVAAWMSEVSPGTKIDTQPIEGTDLVRLRFGHDDSDFFRPTNVGFGLTYTLPVVTALVAAQPESLILLENPEAHLHPHGQSQIGALIARAVGAGAQVLVETHSDHILNGIRIAVRSGLIDPQDVALHYFQRGKGKNSGSEVVTPQLSKEGRLDFWPEGFFDEWDNSLDALM